MYLIADIPPAWMQKGLSKKFCERLGIRVITHKEWVTTEEVSRCLYLVDFDVLKALERNKIHGVIFRYDQEYWVYIHPDKFYPYIEKQAQKRIRDELDN